MAATWFLTEGIYSTGDMVDSLRYLGCQTIVLEHPEYIITETPVHNNIIPYGSIEMVRKVVEQYPAANVWVNDTTHDDWVKWWGMEMLNHAAIVGAANALDVTQVGGNMFVRPVGDYKAFPGQIVSAERYSYWLEALVADKQFDPTNRVIVAPLQEILSETRCFVVNGQVITSSLYMRDNQICLGAAPASHTSYAQTMVDTHDPLEVYALDVAETDDGMRIVEINTMNSSGLYHADTDLFVKALTSL